MPDVVDCYTLRHPIYICSCCWLITRVGRWTPHGCDLDLRWILVGSTRLPDLRLVYVYLFTFVTFVIALLGYPGCCRFGRFVGYIVTVWLLVTIPTLRFTDLHCPVTLICCCRLR